jgi:hypothetical protein
MRTKRPGRWIWAGLILSATALYQSTGCFTLNQVGQVFSDQVALTSAVLIRSIINYGFGAFAG